MFRFDKAAFTSYAAACAVALFSTTMLFAATSVPSVTALASSMA
jgi:hypothetical protein